LLRGRIPSDTKTPFLLSDEFEKDNDQNGHIDFMHAFGNLRAANYKLDEMDWLTVKIKAGRIVPALATTTAVVAGLQTIELCKTIKQCKIEHLKNAFINLAIPYVQLTEPGIAIVASRRCRTESQTHRVVDRDTLGPLGPQDEPQQHPQRSLRPARGDLQGKPTR
jgi:hypothetical protein